MKIFRGYFGRSIVALTVLTALSSTLFGQKQTAAVPGSKTSKNIANVLASPNALVDPVVFGNNPSCADLDALHVGGTGDARFSHIISDWEMKLDFGTPNGTYPYTSGNGRFVTGTQYPNRTFSVSSSSDPAIVSSWSSTLPVTAIIVKVGNLSYVYPYKPFRLGDNDLVTGDSRGISHISICYTEPTNPTAADATVSGRVVDTFGMGISRANIVVVNGATGETKVALTNPFGYYSIGELEAGDIHILNVSHKRYTFQEAQRVVTPNDNLVTADLIGQPK